MYNNPMPHIHTEPGHHDHTVSAFIVRTDGETPKILLHKHRLLNMYMHFGGHIELHEQPWRAIIHEIREESGYDMSQLLLLQPKRRLKKLTGVTLHPQPVCHLTHKFAKLDHSHTDLTYAFIAKSAPKHLVAEGESKELKLFSEKELLKLTKDDIQADLKEIALYVLREIVPEWEPVDPSHYE